ncbi:MAG: endonuclease/exonuclease/phosphatase family protein [Parachlamydiaceae bacterium]|nr:endonuclease/exonuclease/phosphatase family protein [Parachlamydiaceae bacterium]
MFKYFVTLSCSLLIIFNETDAIENSIIPLVERYESVENLNPKKYSRLQFEEISSALASKAQRIRILSYNILASIFDYKHEPINSWPQRLPRILELLNEMQPDVFGVQELYKDQLNDLLPFLSDTYTFVGGPCTDSEINGIFYRKERFELVDSQIWFISSTQVPSSETLTLVHLRDNITNSEFAACNTHLSFSKVDKRAFQAQFIVDKISSVFAQNVPVIFMGDLNTFTQRLDLENLPFYDGDYIHRILTKGPLKDAKEQSLLGHLGPLSTFTNATEEAIPFTGKGTPGIVLDHIYITKGITVLVHAVQPATVGGHFPSDHMPIFSDILINFEQN